MTYVKENIQEAFNQAIKENRLSNCPTDWNYAGHFMYMFTDGNGIDAFKHHATRRYLGVGDREISAHWTLERIAS